jgi:anti-sigma factor RsiW
VPNPGPHLSDWTLEQMAEGELSPLEAAEAAVHLEGCTQCGAELAGYQALYAAIGDLPRFAPSPGFADAVIARTRMEPEPWPITVWLRGLAPKTRRGWFLLGSAVVAPAMPVLAAALWLLTHPLLTPAALWQWVVMQGDTASAAATALLARWVTGADAAGLARGGYSLVSGVPTEALTVLVVALAIAIPSSVWALYRLVRTPTRNPEYAAN